MIRWVRTSRLSIKYRSHLYPGGGGQATTAAARTGTVPRTAGPAAAAAAAGASPLSLSLFLPLTPTLSLSFSKAAAGTSLFRGSSRFESLVVSHHSGSAAAVDLRVWLYHTIQVSALHVRVMKR